MVVKVEKAEILTIGDELLRGEIVDSNKSFLSDRLLGLDIETHFHTSVRDAPNFTPPIAIHHGETVHRDGFVFAGLIPADGAG